MWKRVRKTLLAIFCGQVVVVVGSILLVPLYLTYWSPVVYGEWLVLFALTSYLSTLDLGMNMAVFNRLTQIYARGDLEEYTRCQHSAMVFYISVALGGSLLLALASLVLPFSSWLGIQATPSSEVSWVILILGLYILWAMPASLFSAVYRTTGDMARAQWVGNAQQIIAMAVIALVLTSGGGMKSVAIGQLVLLILVTFYVLWDVWTRFPQLVPGLAKTSLPVLKGLILPSVFFSLLPLSNAITIQGSVLILSSMIRQVVSAVMNSLWPEITGMEARGEFERLRRLHRVLMGASTALCISIAAVFWYEGAEIITVWTRSKLEPDLILLRLLLVLLVLQSTWLVSLVFTAAANRHEKLSRSYLIAAVVGIGTAALLMKWIGTWAIPVGLIVGEALACYHFVIKDTCQMIGEPYGPFALRLWFGLFATLLVALMIGWIAHHGIPGPYFVRWLGVGAVTSIASIAVAWGIWFTSEDRDHMISRLRPLIGFGSGRA